MYLIRKSDRFWDDYICLLPFSYSRCQLIIMFLLFLEPSPSFGECHHQQWPPWGLHSYWSCWYRQASGCGRLSTEACQPGHLAPVYRSTWSLLQEYQDYCWVLGWWADQCCQGMTSYFQLTWAFFIKLCHCCCPEYNLFPSWFSLKPVRPLEVLNKKLQKPF